MLEDLPHTADAATTGTWERHVVRLQNTGDLQAVQEGTGAEAYLFALRELKSTGCPTWLDKVRTSEADQKRGAISLYTFGVDAGPDESSMVKKIVQAASQTDNVM
eukprot:8568177-Pyramimonas_sp.AAC.1